MDKYLCLKCCDYEERHLVRPRGLGKALERRGGLRQGRERKNTEGPSLPALILKARGPGTGGQGCCIWDSRDPQLVPARIARA